MGFHLGVSSFQTADNYACYKFMDKLFFNFVSTYETFGERSVLFQTGRYFDLDLLPLTRYFWTDWDFKESDVKEYVQAPETLIKLVSEFKEKIIAEKDFSKYLSYQSYSEGEEELDELIEESLLEQNPEAKKVIQELINSRIHQRSIRDPWAPYFVEGMILDDLDALLFRLNCYRSKGISEVFLTVG